MNTNNNNYDNLDTHLKKIDLGRVYRAPALEPSAGKIAKTLLLTIGENELIKKHCQYNKISVHKWIRSVVLDALMREMEEDNLNHLVK